MPKKAAEIIQIHGFAVGLGHWEDFCKFAEQQGISLDHEDWIPWFETFMRGAEFESQRG